MFTVELLKGLAQKWLDVNYRKQIMGSGWIWTFDLKLRQKHRLAFHGRKVFFLLFTTEFHKKESF